MTKLDSTGGITGVFFAITFFDNFFGAGFFARVFFSTEAVAGRGSGEADEAVFFETVFFVRDFDNSAAGDAVRTRGGINFFKKMSKAIKIFLKYSIKIKHMHEWSCE